MAIGCRHVGSLHDGHLAHEQAVAQVGLETQGINIWKQGNIKAETIGKNKLIDQHYYSIASKATPAKV